MGIEDDPGADADDLEPPLEPLPHGAVARRPRASWLGVVAVLMLLAAAVTVVVGPWRHPTASAAHVAEVPLPHPRAITEDGVVYPVERIHPAAALADPADPKIIRIVGEQFSGSSSPPCNRFRPTARLARQSADGVVVAAFAYFRPPPGTTNMLCVSAIGGPGKDDGLVTTVIHLSSPLGTRTIYDARDGSVVPVIDLAYVPEATYVPAGFTLRMVQRLDAGALPQALRQYDRGGIDLELSAQPREESGTDPASTMTDVNGHHAALTDDKAHACVAWYATPGLLDQVCSYGSGHLGTAELLRVARSVR